MIRYFVRRLGLILITLLVISLAIFAIVEILPGDVAKMMLKQTATEEALHRIREELGFLKDIGDLASEAFHRYVVNINPID